MSSLAIEVSADTTRAVANLAKLRAEMAEQQKTLRALTQEQLNNGSDELSAGQLQAAEAVAKTQAQMRTATATTKTLAKEADGAGAAIGGAAMASHRFTRELIVMAHEASTGRYSRLGGSFMVLGESIGNLTPATLGWAAAIGVAGVATYEVVKRWHEVEQAVKGARGAMIMAGTYTPQSDDQTRGMVARMSTLFGFGTSEFAKSSADIQGMGGAAAQYKAQIADVAAAQAKLTNGDLAKTTEEVAKAFNAGADGALKWADGNHLLTASEHNSIEALVKAGAQTEAMGRILDAANKRFVSSAEVVAKAQQTYQHLARLRAAGLTEAQWEKMHPPAGATTPKSGTQANQGQDELQTAIDKAEPAFQKVRDLQAEIDQLKKAVSAGDANASTLLAEKERDLAQVHTQAQQDAHEKTIDNLQRELIAAKDNAGEQVAIKKQRAAEDSRFYTADSQQARQAQTEVLQAQRAAGDQALAMTRARLTGQEALARDDIGKQIALAKQWAGALQAGGKTDTPEYVSAIARVSELQKQASQKEVADKLDAIKREIEAETTGGAQKEALLKRYHDVYVAGLASTSEAFRQAKDFETDQEAKLTASAAAAAEKKLEAQRRGLDQQESADLRHTEMAQRSGELTVSQAEQAQLLIVSAHSRAVDAILASERTKASGIESIEREIASRQTEEAQQAADKQRQITDQAAEQTAAKWRGANEEIASSFASGVTGMLKKGQSWQQDMARLFEQVAQNGLKSLATLGLSAGERAVGVGSGAVGAGSGIFGDLLNGLVHGGGAAGAVGGAGAQGVQQQLLTALTGVKSAVTQNTGGILQWIGNGLQWIAQELGLTTATTASVTATTASATATVAQTTATTGLIPALTLLTADLIANTSALIANTASKALPSYAVGAWNVPNDMIAQIHAGEMIVPAAQAQMIRAGGTPANIEALGTTLGKGYGGNAGNAGGSAGASVSVAISAMDSKSVVTALRNPYTLRALTRGVTGQLNNNPSLRPAY